MNKKRLRLKRWVSVGVYLSLVSLVFISMLFVSNILDNKYEGTYNLSYILKNFIKSAIQVTSIDDGKTTKPFTAENVNIPDIIQKTPDAPTDLCAYMKTLICQTQEYYILQVNHLK